MDQIKELRTETKHMFYHGFDNYLEHAFPEDELRPLTCGPLVRDRANPAHTELNDVLGNYSLTLIDSLSTLAIMASSDDDGARSWTLFQNGVKDLVTLYGDGSEGPAGQGKRARGFDMDSKVQVFETVIRGLGGLLSAHLFAIGELPITGYVPSAAEASFASAWDKSSFPEGSHGIEWANGFTYDGQLLRLAVDLTNRLLPAFYTETGLPYPRVNLRHGVPFYPNSPFNKALSCEDDGDKSCVRYRQLRPEITETCSAGAGSLVLEFTVLSRLTGDGRYEELAKRAFWAVWSRKSDIGLIGAGIDTESGRWVNSYTGIGAGIDSFFEYAFKSYVLLSSDGRPGSNQSSPWHAWDNFYHPLSEYEHSPEAFLQVWQESYASIKRHLYRGEGYRHPHFIQGDLFTGATRAVWIDSLSAYYPGLLVLAGELEDATRIHLLSTAIWTRFSALPERWNVATGDIEGGLSWWGGRPEFIESTYYLYRATSDPWYLHVGEMVLRDIKRRCWTNCGWAGLQDVQSGALNDRMESFFLGETTKYMFLLFDPAHPLNHLDASFVFSTEGHPLIIPRLSRPRASRPEGAWPASEHSPLCQTPPSPQALGFSSTAARPDIFHAANLARLHLMPRKHVVEGPLLEGSIHHPGISLSDLSSPTNYTFYPWTLPPQLVPCNATSSPMTIRTTLDITFPVIPGMVTGPGSLERVLGGVFIKTIGGLRLSMVREALLKDSITGALGEAFRIQLINDVPLGKDEKVYLSREVTFDVLDPSDPNFTRVRDTSMIDIVIDVPLEHLFQGNASNNDNVGRQVSRRYGVHVDHESLASESRSENIRPTSARVLTVLTSIMSHVSSFIRDETSRNVYVWSKSKQSSVRLTLPALLPTGVGSAPLPDVEDASTASFLRDDFSSRLSWSTMYFSDEACDYRIPLDVAQNYQILVLKRGGCTFSEKLRNIAAYPSSRSSLKLVIVVSYDDEAPNSDSFHGFAYAHGSSRSSASSSFPNNLAARRAEPFLSRPFLDQIQMTAGGLPRHHLIPMVMVGGGEETYELLKRASGLGIKRRYMIRAQGVPIENLYIL